MLHTLRPSVVGWALILCLLLPLAGFENSYGFENSAYAVTSGGQSSDAAPMTNADVIALSAAGIPDSVIIAKIRAAPSTKFDTTVDGLKALMAARVSTAVVEVMVGPVAPQPGFAAGWGTAATATNNDDPLAMHQYGVWADVRGDDGELHLRKMEAVSGTPKVVGFTSDGRKIITEQIDGSAASFSITNSLKPIFYFYYGRMKRPVHLTVMQIENDHRETAQSDRWVLAAEEVAPGIIKITFPRALLPGEYAIALGTFGPFYDFGIHPTQ
jgi:hypothetical protein